MESIYRLLLWLLLLLMAVAYIGIKVRFDTDKNSRLAELEVQNITQDKQIMELQKEIRILKTDIYILQYGYEGEENDQRSDIK